HAVNPDGEGKARSGFDVNQGSERFGVDDFQVFHAGERLGFEDGEGFGADRLHRAFPGGDDGLRPCERATQGDGGCSSGGAQADVARAHGEAVGFANGFHRDDVEPEVEVAHHLPNHGELLEVLFAEVGAVRLDDVEELGDDGGDAAEVAGAEGAAQAVGEDVHLYG